MKLYISANTDQPGDKLNGFVSAAVAEIEKLGHTPFSPVRHDGTLLPWSLRLECLTKECHGIYLLEGWQDCIEASAERMLCLTTGKQVIYQSSIKKKLDDELVKTAASLKIQQAIHEVTGRTMEEILVKSREGDLVFIRMIFSRHALRAGLSPDEIAEILGKNRSTVYYYFNRYDDEFRFTPTFRRMALAVDQLLQ